MYTLGEFHKNWNNSTVFEELSMSIVDLTVANICFTGLVSFIIIENFVCLCEFEHTLKWYKPVYKVMYYTF
jgi:hypothetical protein